LYHKTEEDAERLDDSPFLRLILGEFEKSSLCGIRGGPLYANEPKLGGAMPGIV